MLVETLIGHGGSIFVGIGEASIGEKRTLDTYLKLVKSQSKGLLAVQLMDSSALLDEVHILSAVQNAVNAWKGNYMISRSLDVEIVLYASGQKQISRALQQVGISEATVSVAVVVLGVDKDTVRSTLLETMKSIGSPITTEFSPSLDKVHRIMESFDISESEIRVFTESRKLEDLKEAVSRCIASRVSSVALDA